MKLELLRDSRGNWSGRGEYEPGIDPKLKPCPFVHVYDDEELIADNTHGPFFTVSCSCGAEGPRSYAIENTLKRRASRRTAEEILTRAFHAAIEAWNRRTKDAE